MTEIEIDSSEVEHPMLVNMTTFGVDDWLFTINVCLGIVFVFGLKMIKYIPVLVVTHFVLFYVSRVSPNILEKYWKFKGQSQYYTRDPLPNQSKGLRPFGFGRGVSR